MSDRCDPSKTKHIAVVLTKLIPDATIQHHDLGDFQGVEYTITHPKGSGWFRITYECFNEELTKIETWTHQAASMLSPGERWQLDSTGMLNQIPV